MKRIQRLGVLISTGVFASAFVIFLANYFINFYSITDIAPKATIVGGVLTFLGTIFSAVYKEISSYYNGRATNAAKKWDLIFPFIKKHYNPWINSALSLLNALSSVKDVNITDNQVMRILFLVLLFYGVRLRFILDDGGLVLLSTTEEEKKVTSAYRDIERSFDWAGIDTPLKVAELQRLFVSKGKPDKPYVSADFIEDLSKSPFLQESRDKLKQWLVSEENRKKLNDKLDDFVKIFQSSIDKLYKDWEG